MNLKRLVIGSFNLYNLNEPGKAIYTDADGWSQAEYDLKIEWTARAIRILRPDIFGLQELWHSESLKRALAASGLSQDYDLVVPADANGSRIVCAAIVRKGLLTGAPRWIVDFPEKFKLHSSGDDPQTPAISVNINSFSRPVLHFTVKPREERDDIHVYVCHFKSKGPTKIFRESWYRADQETYSKHSNGLGSAISTIRRTAEAAAMRFILTEQMKGTDTPVVVLGDINDGQHSNTVNILSEQPKYLFGSTEGGRDTSFYTAQTLQEFRNTRDVYYTHIHDGIMESLDHILVSQEFYENSKKRIWTFDGMVVSNDHLNFDDHKSDGTNDHGIICAAFEYKPVRKSAQKMTSDRT